MLVLSRRQNERIVIGEPPDTIIITVTEVERGRVHLGIIAPKNVRINRAENATDIQAEVLARLTERGQL